ncbi:MAG: UDP-N-acetylmuramoyl-tripeptide--D-alanyl-D-alanine ligase [Pseudomonadota bacterium]|nr:UDP-N-acetylmuramoyl-tripeptide--D-alanyl-D-alanine ligase [Pseudomonadota bacterium]
MIKVTTVETALGKAIHQAAKGSAETFSQVSIDTRTLEAGALFVAIQGERFDGHEFIHCAIEQGATGVVSQKSLEADAMVWQVPDTTMALGQMAKAHLAQLNLEKVAITGSVGKTSVKQMTSAILSGVGKTQATKGNLNNHWGMPLTGLSIEADTQYGVFELGASAQGEIAYTANLVKPNVALVNNVAGVHLEGFGSLEGVYQGKTEIYHALSKDGTAVINLDEAFASRWLALANELGVKTRTFALNDSDVKGCDIKPDIFAKNIRLSAEGVQFELVVFSERTEVNLPLAGEHNVRNALAAAALCHALGVSIKEIATGLATTEQEKGRLQRFTHLSGAQLIDDSYNANEKSVKAAIDVLMSTPGPETEKLLALGFLGELGEYQSQTCEAIARYASEKGLKHLLVIGEQALLYQPHFEGELIDCESIDQALAWIQPRLNKSTVVLAKGSRSAAMERVIQGLIKEEETCSTT